MSKIDHILSETRSFSPPTNIKNANLTADLVTQLEKKAATDYQGFWADLAKKYLSWHQEFTDVLDESKAPFYKWFADGLLNVSYNCIDRHLKDKANKVAIMFEDEKGESYKLTYQELYHEVAKLSNALQRDGIGKGDRVIIYMPMNAQAVIAMQACARIGAIHSVIFGGFSASAIYSRVLDARSKMVITADGAYRAGKIITLKNTVDEALALGENSVKKVVVQKRLGNDIKMNPNLDVYLDDFIADCSNEHEAQSFSAEDILFLLYTSGSTGTPKGIVHSSAGYLLNSLLTCYWLLDLKDEDVFWCTADVGWITGHSYVCYGPLALGTTIVIYEGAPSVPDIGRFWSIIEKYKVSVFYTAPTAIRSFIKGGDEFVSPYDLSSLRVLGTVGEPINPEAWMWYYNKIGAGKCPIVDTWWQTETGAHMLAPIPYVTTTKPGSCAKPMPGIMAKIIDEDGQELPNNAGGKLVITKPWPSMLRGVWNDDKRYADTYFPKDTCGYYLAGDSAFKDKDGYYWILGRIDDVLNVSGHRLGTSEIESSLVAHKYVAEAAVVGRKDDLTGEAIVAFIVLQNNAENLDEAEIITELKAWVTKDIGAIARPKEICFGPNLPKTRSGKIMRRLLRSIANKEEITQDISTLENPAILDAFLKK